MQCIKIDKSCDQIRLWQKSSFRQEAEIYGVLKHYFLLKMGTGNGGTWIRMCSNEGVEKTEVKQALHRGQITENPSEARFFLESRTINF